MERGLEEGMAGRKVLDAQIQTQTRAVLYYEVAHISLDLYMSESSRVMGTFPMVFLKNTSSMVDGPTERRAGKSNSSFPKRHG